MATHLLIPVADHGPAALQMQRNLTLVKPNRRQILLGVDGDLRRDVLEMGMSVKLPDAIDVPGPGATGVGIARRGTTQCQEILQEPSQLQRVQRQLNRCHGRWKQLVNLKPVHGSRCTRLSLALQANKKAGPEGPAFDESIDRKDQAKELANSGSTARNFQDLLSNRSLTGLVVVKGEGLGQLLGVIAGVVHGRHPAGQL